MFRVLRLVLVAGSVLFVLNAIDGGSLVDPLRWMLSNGREGELPGIVAALGWGFALFVVLVLLPCSWMPSWQRERTRWLSVGELLLNGPPTSPVQSEECYAPEIRRRLGLLLVFVGGMFLVSELLEMHVHSCVEDRLNAVQNQSYWCAITFTGAAALGIVAFGLATPFLWSRPVLRVWTARLLVLVCMAALFAEIAERESMHRMLMAVREVRTYREGIVSIWITAGATVAFFGTGWTFSERGRPIE